MSVGQRHIILYGYKYPYGSMDEDAETYSLRGWERGDVAIISDGMGAEYLFVGVLIHVTDDARLGDAAIPITEIGDIDLQERTALETRITELGLADDQRPEFYAFTHYY